MVRWRPHKYNNAAARMRTAAAAIAMPAVAPLDSPPLEDDAGVVIGVATLAAYVLEEAVDEAVVDVGAAEVVDALSVGKYSPGLNIKVEFFAYSSWT